MYAVVVGLVPHGNVTVAGDDGVFRPRVGVDVGAGRDGAAEAVADDDGHLGVVAEHAYAPKSISPHRAIRRS